MTDNTDLKAFRRQLKEEIAADTKNLIREVMGEILQTARGKQLIDLDEGEATIGKPRDRDDDLETVLVDPHKQEFQVAVISEDPTWAKKMAKMRSQMQLLMRDKGMDASMDYSDMGFDNQEPLPKKFKFPDMKKYSGT